MAPVTLLMLPTVLPLVVPPVKELPVVERLLIDGRTVNPPLDPPEFPKALPAVPLTIVPADVTPLVPEVPALLLLTLVPFAVSERVWPRVDTVSPVKGFVKPLISGSGDGSGDRELAEVCDKPLVTGRPCVEEKKGEG